MIKNALLFYITYILLGSESIAQCVPMFAETCLESNVFCSLDELNGYVCNNASSKFGHCTPVCSQGGVGHNMSWWGFVTEGGKVTITLTIGGCSSSQGLQFGIWGDCLCSEEIICRSIPCIPPNSVQVINANLEACKTYYLWIDGCSGDICDFTINTGGGGIGPPLDAPRFINNVDRMVIEPVCIGACNYRFFIDPQASGCSPTYVWTLDGNEVGGNSNEVLLDFPDEGNFTLCVTLYKGNPSSSSICSQIGPRCATVKVRPNQDRLGQDIILCREQVIPGG